MRRRNNANCREQHANTRTDRHQACDLALLMCARSRQPPSERASEPSRHTGKAERAVWGRTMHMGWSVAGQPPLPPTPVVQPHDYPAVRIQMEMAAHVRWMSCWMNVTGDWLSTRFPLTSLKRVLIWRTGQKGERRIVLCLPSIFVITPVSPTTYDFRLLSFRAWYPGSVRPRKGTGWLAV
jgi:hypothetical protein